MARRTKEKASPIETFSQYGEAVVFDMGLYEAVLPKQFGYSDIHFWFAVRNDNGSGPKTRCGLTTYASRLLGDVYRLEWSVKVGSELNEADLLGEVESTKATSELYSPMAGTITAVNEEVAAKPRKLEKDPFAAWLLEFSGEPKRFTEGGPRLEAHAYRDFLAEGWEETQKLLKGQM